MHDLLFENQDALDDYDLVRYAQSLDLDMTRFRTELLQGVHTPHVREDFVSGIRSGVNGTPTFFLNGRRLDTGWDIQSLLDAIEMETRSAPGPAADDAPPPDSSWPLVPPRPARKRRRRSSPRGAGGRG